MMRAKQFIKEYLKEIEENNAAIFAGAGLSVASGHVDWKKLMKEFADELDLDIKKEHDLISLAQYHLNKNANNRHAITNKILNEFHHGKLPNPNHEILARLPISTFWTTNYDKLLEKGLEKSGKIVDVKYTTKHLANTVHGRNAIVYKMHGDVDHPDEAIISKDQYEQYFKTHGAFVNTLAGDLVSKTFLFIGFSFTDPNLEHVLSRIRVSFQNNQRRHYCFFKNVSKEDFETEEEYEYQKIKQLLLIQDLLRFNIHSVLVDEYSQITEILKEIESRYKRKTLYISGSAIEYNHWDANTGENFISILSQNIIKQNFKIVSGFGLGVGSSVINGVLQEVYLEKKENLKDQLLLRPFPQGPEGKQQWDNYRRDMISYAGLSIFVFGNKSVDGKIVLADGMKREFEISKEQGILIIPIGATGYVAKEIWTEVLGNYEECFHTHEHKEIFQELGNEKLTPQQLIQVTIDFLKLILK